MGYFWKRIDLKNLETIRTKTLDFLYKETSLLEKTKFRGPFINLKKFGFLDRIPEIAESFRKLDLFPDDASIYVTYRNKDSAPHKDYTDSIGRVNIPILNFEGSFTTFYANVKARRLVLPTGAPFYLTSNTDYYEVDRMPFDFPAIVRISEGHDIVMDETRVPRVTLTISTTPDAGLLLDD
jgi:hypothetical protein